MDWLSGGQTWRDLREPEPRFSGAYPRAGAAPARPLEPVLGGLRDRFAEVQKQFQLECGIDQVNAIKPFILWHQF